MSFYNTIDKLIRTARAIPPTELAIQQLHITRREAVLTLTDSVVTHLRGTIYYAADVVSTVLDSQRIIAGYFVARIAAVIPPMMRPDNTLTFMMDGLTLDGDYLVFNPAAGGVTGNQLTFDGSPLTFGGDALVFGQ